MVKVGILSMQRIANYGSFLQAYGLKRIFEELGCEVQFVDYHPGETLIPDHGGTGIRRKIFKILEVFKNRAPLIEKFRFIQYKKNFAAKYYPYLGISRQMNYSPELDLLVIGSDEVFNCVQNNANVGFSPELFGKGNKAKRVVSYAASFGNTTEEKLIQKKVADKIGRWLKRLDAVSVRDENSGKIVKAVAGITPKYHLDPVLVYDFTGNCSDIPDSVPEQNYMILYGYSGRFSKEECKEIRAFIRKRGLKVLCIGGVQEICHRFIDCNPLQVIAYFQHAECVVTDTFHGTILSVITHRPFVSVGRKSGYGNEEKMTSLLGRLGLDGRMVHCPEAFMEILEKKIDYKAVDEIICAERTSSYQYLFDQLKGIN